MLLCIVLGLVLILTLNTLFLCHDPISASKKTLSAHQLLCSMCAYLENDGTLSCSQNLKE